MTTAPRTATQTHSGTQPAIPTSGLQRTLVYCAVVLSGLFAGFLVTVLVLEGSMRSDGAAVYTQVRLIELRHLDDLATVLLIPAVLAIAALTLITLRRHASRHWLFVIALLLLSTTLVISVSVSVPINTMQQRWSMDSSPDDWAAIRDRWQLAHATRTATAVLAFLILAAVPLRGNRQGVRH